MFRQAREQELEELRRKKEEEEWKEAIIREEKRKILEEFLKDYEEYMPKGLL